MAPKTTGPTWKPTDIVRLINKTGEDMMKVRNMGRKSLEEVQNKLAMMGLSLASDDSANSNN